MQAQRTSALVSKRKDVSESLAMTGVQWSGGVASLLDLAPLGRKQAMVQGLVPICREGARLVL